MSPITEISASFTPEQLQFIGALAVMGFMPIVGIVWMAASWKTKLEHDIDNLGAIIGTKKGLALKKEREQKGE